MKRQPKVQHGLSVQRFEELRSIAFATEKADKKAEEKKKPKK